MLCNVTNFNDYLQNNQGAGNDNFWDEDGQIVFGESVTVTLDHEILLSVWDWDNDVLIEDADSDFEFVF